MSTFTNTPAASSIPARRVQGWISQQTSALERTSLAHTHQSENDKHECMNTSIRISNECIRLSFTQHTLCSALSSTGCVLESVCAIRSRMFPDKTLTASSPTGTCICSDRLRSSSSDRHTSRQASQTLMFTSWSSSVWRLKASHPEQTSGCLRWAAALHIRHSWRLGPRRVTVNDRMNQFYWMILVRRVPVSDSLWSPAAAQTGSGVSSADPHRTPAAAARLLCVSSEICALLDKQINQQSLHIHSLRRWTCWRNSWWSLW